MKFVYFVAPIILVFIFIVPIVFRKRYTEKRHKLYDKYEGKMTSVPTRLRFIGMFSCIAFGLLYANDIMKSLVIWEYDGLPNAVRNLILCIVGAIALHLYARFAFPKRYNRPFGEVLKDHILYGYYSLMLNLRVIHKFTTFMMGFFQWSLNSVDEHDPHNWYMSRSQLEYHNEQAAEGTRKMFCIYRFSDIEGI